MNLLHFFVLILVASCVVVQPASAYLDPGTGSIIWQMVVAVGFAIVYTLKTYWQKIRKLFEKE